MRGVRKAVHRLTAVLVMAVVLFMVPAQVARAELSDWRTTFGLVEKYGNDEDGYFIYGKGDVDSSCLDYEVPFDLMNTEISFKFEAHPFNEYFDATWAYLAIYPYSNDPNWISAYTYEENQAAGRIEFLLEQHADGSMGFCLFQNPIARTLINIPDFDYEAVHTISFEEKLMGAFVVFDGMTLGEVDLTQEIQKHIGENAGNSYLRVGGLQQFAFEHLKIGTLEAKPDAEPTQTETKDPAASDKPPKKLGSLADKEDDEQEKNDELQEKDDEEGFTLMWLWVILLAVVIVAAIVGIVILMIKRQRGKKEEE